MNEIQEILAGLNRISGVTGSSVLTKDGITVVSMLGSKMLDEVVAGLSSFLLSTTRRSLAEAEMGTFQRFVLNSTHGKLILVDLGDAVLVVMTDQFVTLKNCLATIDEAAVDLRRIARIHV
jgi:predicted regulator of Ras-like GTPase activity (Roadblock/LC7/MglB family)